MMALNKPTPIQTQPVFLKKLTNLFFAFAVGLGTLYLHCEENIEIKRHFCFTFCMRNDDGNVNCYKALSIV